jgi:hypothetical protein
MMDQNKNSSKWRKFLRVKVKIGLSLVLALGLGLGFRLDFVLGLAL